MLYNHNLRPAYATAGGESSAKSDRSKIKDFFTRSEADDASKLGGQRANPTRPAGAPNQQPHQQPRRRPTRPAAKNDLWKYIAMGAAAVVAIVLLIVIIVAIVSAPQKNLKREDNVYFSYVDSDGKYRVVSNGDTLKQVFEGEVEVIPAADASFAYVIEEIAGEEDAGYNMYVLNGRNLKSIEATADKIIDLAEYEPGIVYKENGRFYYYSSDDHSPITSDDSADNFMISGNADAVVYTMDSAKESEQVELRYFCNGGSLKIGPYNFVPSAISNDGKYVYGIFRNVLCYLEVEDHGEEFNQEVITNNTYGEIVGITGMNVKGNEIIFAAQPANKDNPISYMYKIGSSEPTQIAEGVFTPVFANKTFVCPETFINSYFECKKNIVDEEGDETAETTTYFLDKDNGARKLANTTGTFSLDQKYFYYINEEDKNLVRVPLGSKDFAKDTDVVFSDASDFAIIENGDLYVMVEDVDVGFIYFIDSSSKKKTRISHQADLESMQVCANSVYFSETNDEDVTTIYVSTEGSAKEKAEFKASTPASTPIIEMGARKRGYAYFVDENGNTKLFYTSNGKKFNLLSDACSIPGYSEDFEPDTDTQDPATAG